MQVLLSSFHLNGHTLGFHPQTQKVQPHILTQGLTLGVKGLNYLNKFIQHWSSKATLCKFPHVCQDAEKTKHSHYENTNTVESGFLKPPRETTMSSRNQELEISGVKLQ